LRLAMATLIMSLVPSMPTTLVTAPSVFRRVTLQDGTDLRPPFVVSRQLMFDASRLPPAEKQTADRLWALMSEIVLDGHIKRYAHGQPQGQDNGNWALSAFVSVMRWLLHSPHQARDNLPLFETLFELYVSIDKLEMIHDNNKAELIQLLLKFIAGIEPTLKVVCKTHTNAERLMNCFIKIAPNEKLRAYNNLIMPAFYSLVHHACAYSSPAFETVLMHRNLRWAMQYLYLENPEYAPIADKLWDIFRSACQTARSSVVSADIRKRQTNQHADGVKGPTAKEALASLARWTQPGRKLPSGISDEMLGSLNHWRRDTLAFMLGLDKMARNPRNYFRLLEVALICEQDWVTFVENNGLSQLCAFIATFIDASTGTLVESDESARHLTRALRVLNGALQHVLWWSARDRTHRASLPTRWKGARTLVHALVGIVGAPYAHARRHLQLAHAALQRLVALDEPALLEPPRTDVTPLSLPNDASRTPPIALPLLLTEFTQHWKERQSFEVMRSARHVSVLSADDCRDSDDEDNDPRDALTDGLVPGCVATPLPAVSTLNTSVDGDDDDASLGERTNPTPPADLINPAAVAADADAMRSADDDDNNTNNDDNNNNNNNNNSRSRRVEQDINDENELARFAPADKQTLVRDDAARARYVDMYAQLAFQVVHRIAQFGDDAHVNIRLEVQLALLLAMDDPSVAHVELVFRYWLIDALKPELAHSDDLHAFLINGIVDSPTALLDSDAFDLFEHMFRATRALIAAVVKRDAIERINDGIGMALAVSQSLSTTAPDDTQHRVVLADALEKLGAALRALCILLRDRTCRRHAKACGLVSSIDQLLSLTMLHRDLLPQGPALQACKERPDKYRELLALSEDDADSGDESAAAYTQAFEEMSRRAALDAELDAPFGEGSLPQMSPIESPPPQ